MFIKLFSLIFLLVNLSYAKQVDNIYHFAPLPTKNFAQNTKEFIPIMSHLSKELNIKVKYVHLKNYDDILKGFENGSIDMAYLGPLPFVSLYKEYKYVKPIITFKQKNGLAKYRCVLAKFHNDKLDTSLKFKVALTQPLSTCGYLMSNILLKKKFGVDLKNEYYDYTMSHINALISTVKGEFLIAGAKESIAKKFKSLGVEIIAKSQLLPGFSLVVNTKTMSKKVIDEIQQTLLSLSNDDLQKIGGIISRGVVIANIKDYDVLKADFTIPKYGNIDEK